MCLWKLFGRKSEEIEEVKTIDNGPVVLKKEVEEIVSEIQPLDLMKVRFSRAVNQSNRRDEIRAIILHHIYMGSFKKSEKFLINKASGVSSHYLLGVDDLVQTVNTKKKAWHAGVSEWEIGGRKRTNLNNCTIGIEILNPGVMTKNGDKFYFNNGGTVSEWTGDKPEKTSIVYPSGKILEGYSVPYPEKQLNKLIALCKGIVKKYPQIGSENIMAHYQIAQPEGRKNDPFGLDIEYVRRRIFE